MNKYVKIILIIILIPFAILFFIIIYDIASYIITGRKEQSDVLNILSFQNKKYILLSNYENQYYDIMLFDDLPQLDSLDIDPTCKTIECQTGNIFSARVKSVMVEKLNSDSLIIYVDKNTLEEVTVKKNGVVSGITIEYKYIDMKNDLK